MADESADEIVAVLRVTEGTYEYKVKAAYKAEG